jgi:hypothetical protein
MTKFGDIIATIAFTSLFGFYTLQVLGFGGLTGESPFLYVLCSVGGLVLIWVSFKDKLYHSPKIFNSIRLLAFVLLYAVIYFDLKHSKYFLEASVSDKIFSGIFHLMSLTVLLYMLTTFLRLRRLLKNNKNRLTADT